MQITLQPATIDQKPLLANLFEFYAYEFTEFCDFDIGDDGLYGYEHLPLYWTESTRFPYLIYVDQKIAGFALVQQGSLITSDIATWDVAEFFVMKKYKRQGVGTTAAIMLWQQHPGKWQVRVLSNNHSAQQFWAHAIKHFTTTDPSISTHIIKDKKLFVYSFESCKGKAL